MADQIKTRLEPITFSEIFKKSFGTKNLNIEKIIIPKIQRDYAQGRQIKKIKVIREKFLKALFESINKNEPLTLDLVYGDINNKGVMIPLDGQQRLTTLFLLHWYAYRKFEFENPNELIDFNFLKNFSYDTRYTARHFCEKLFDEKFKPSFKKNLSEDIINQAWFPLSWKDDPTVSSMLVMLDAIDDKFKYEKDLWKKLQSGLISFYFLPIEDMGLTDDLYIKMNSRGKPLTDFENLKAEFIDKISQLEENSKIDVR